MTIDAGAQRLSLEEQFGSRQRSSMALAKGALWLSLWSCRVLARGAQWLLPNELYGSFRYGAMGRALARGALWLSLKELYGSLYRALGFLSHELYCIALDIGAH